MYTLGGLFSSKCSDTLHTSVPACWSVWTLEDFGQTFYLVIIFIFTTVAVDSSLSRHLIAFQIFIVGSDLVDNGTIRHDLDDSVCGGLYDLMVTRGKEKYSREFNETVVQSGDGLHIQVVSRFIQKQDVSAGDHQLAEHAADFLSSGQDADFLHAVFTGEEHTPQETTDISSIFDLRILGQPVNDGVVVIELFGVILREIGLGSGNTPLLGSLVRLDLYGKDLEQSSLRQLAASYESHLVFTTHSKGDVN